MDKTTKEQNKEGKCLVCNDPIISPVKCLMCDTVYHEECFKYREGCSIFSCESDKYTKPQTVIYDATGKVLAIEKIGTPDITDLIAREETLPVPAKHRYYPTLVDHVKAWFGIYAHEDARIYFFLKNYDSLNPYKFTPWEIIPFGFSGEYHLLGGWGNNAHNVRQTIIAKIKPAEENGCYLFFNKKSGELHNNEKKMIYTVLNSFCGVIHGEETNDEWCIFKFSVFV